MSHPDTEHTRLMSGASLEMLRLFTITSRGGPTLRSLRTSLKGMQCGVQIEKDFKHPEEGANIIIASLRDQCCRKGRPVLTCSRPGGRSPWAGPPIGPNPQTGGVSPRATGTALRVRGGG